MKSILSCDYGAGRYNIKIEDPKRSPYFGLYPAVRSLDYLPYYSTIDDPVILDAAEQLNAQLKGRDDRIKIAVVLSMIQQNIRYVSDESRFGKDLWELPIYTICERKADCDGMASLFTSLAHNMGLDVATVIVTGHMCSAVHLEGLHGVSYELDGKEYFHVETTANLPAVGRYWDSTEFIHIARPEKPTGQFLSTLSKDY